MARQNQIRSINQCLEDDAYGEINSYYSTLSIREAVLILEKLMDNNISSDEQFDIIQANDIISLVKDKIIPTLQYFKLNAGKQNVRKLKNQKSIGANSTRNNMDSITDAQVKRIGCAYRILGDCYNYLGEITSAINYYTKAERCGLDCSQEIRVLDTSNPTPKLKHVVDKAKKLNGATYQKMSAEITDYAYAIIDDILQLSVVQLSDDIHDNLRTAFATYLRKEVAGIHENAPMITLAGCFEKMLKEFLYIPYAQYLDDNAGKSQIESICQRLRSKKIARVDKKDISFTKFANNFTLGNFKYLIIESIRGETYNIDQTFYDFITKYYHIDTNQFSQDDFISLARFSEVFRDTIRNPSGHGVGMSRQAFALVCEELLLKDNSWIKQIVKITNNEYLKPEELGKVSNDSLIATMAGTRVDVKSFISEFQGFIEKKGCQPSINSRFKSERLLAKKANTIRLSLQGNNFLELGEREIEMLNQIGFVWEQKIDQFKQFYTDLLQYKNEYGNLDIPEHYVGEDGKHLGRQVMKIRKTYKEKKLSLVQISILNNIGFEWDYSKSKWFDNFYQELVEYKVIHGTFKGVVYDKDLGYKVIAFIRNYQQQKLGKPTNTEITEEMILKLDDIGFELSKTKDIKKTY